MKIETINGIRVATPESRMLLCNEEQKVICEKVYLGVNSEEALWKEIAEAEKMAVLGAEKMQWVVGKIYNSLSALARAYFTKERIEAIAQKLFDTIRAYADKYKERTKEE